MQNTLLWQSNQYALAMGLPAGFVTFGPPFDDPAIPREVTMLLPAGPGNTGLLEYLRSGAAQTENLGVGLFLNDPFINLKNVASTLRELEIKWVANLPSVAQHDPSFRSQLSDVGFTVESEFIKLAKLGKEGFKTLGVISEAEQLKSVTSQLPDALLVVQNTTDLQISFPSETHRRSIARAVEDSRQAKQNEIPVLSIASPEEHSRVDYPVIARPTPWIYPDKP